MSFVKFLPRVKQWTGDRLPAPRPTVARVVSGEARSIVRIDKAVILRSESYRRFVASHACFDCGVTGYSQCAHENEGKGLSMKVCDTRTFPLCGPRFRIVGCHQAFDLGLGLDRDERREQGRQWVLRMHALARAANRPEIA